MANLVLFFGAGASAPFGIPTMQQMVLEFEETLKGEKKAEERRLYEDIRGFLNATLGRPTDLEAVFTIVDSILNWSPERLGISALYHAVRFMKGAGLQVGVAKPPQPLEDDVRVAASLRSDFEKFVQSSCQLREGQMIKAEQVYRDFFSNMAGASGGTTGGAGGQYVVGDWPMFTTNYDAILEHYWMDRVQIELNTGFSYNSVAKMEVSNPERLRGGGLRLFKLHGSITWLLDERWGLTEQRVPPHEMKTYTGGKFLGQVMLYPIEEKELYVEPYMTMFLMLNRLLSESQRWMVVGYSFSDRFIRDIFVRNSHKETNLVLLHPHATEIAARLKGFQGSVRSLPERFGGGDYPRVNNQAASMLRLG